MNTLKIFLIIFVVGIALDAVWISVVAKSFYASQIGEWMRMKDGKLDFIPWAALAVYLLICTGLLVFVLPQISNSESPFLAFGMGALFGLVCYGLYDFTNYATLARWPLAYALVDVSWGSFLCGALTLTGFWARQWLEKA